MAMLALLAVSACAPASPPASSYPVSAEDTLPTLDWRTWIEGREVFVEIEDLSAYYDTMTMELIAPGGQRIPADSVTRINRQYRDAWGRPTVGIGGSTGSQSGIGVGVSVPLGLGGGPEDESIRRIVGRFVVPDMYEYRRTASDWEIVIRLTARSGETSRATIPAPLP